VVIVLLKVATMCISMFAGLNYLQKIIYDTIERETLFNRGSCVSIDSH
jgi:hypothetical protein